MSKNIGLVLCDLIGFMLLCSVSQMIVNVRCSSLILSLQGQQQIFEDESKQIRCLNAQMLRCCTYNQRTVLIVCSKYWQVVLRIVM